MPSSVPECSDSHELETLMLQGSHECGHPLEEASEEQSLMASANQGEEEETPTPEPKVRICNSKALYQTGFEYFLSHVGRGIIGESTVLLFLQAAWNGSVSHNWGNRITRYRDTITEDSPTLINGALNMFITDNGTVNE